MGKISQYTLLAEIEAHGGARVFRARDTVMDRPVLLKLLPKDLRDDPQFAERFKREMILAAKLQHPNIVTTYSGGEVEGNMIIATEFVIGVTLEDRLQREGNVPEKIAWLIAKEIAKALAFAAKHGILHRNINPASIFCAEDGKVKLGEFGLSKALTDQSNLTSAGTTVGSAFYISPEQAGGTEDLDPRTDVYSLGCTVFHMLTGSFPFMNQSMVEVMGMHVNAPRPDAHSILPEIGVASSELVKRMMAVSMDGRPASADALITEIDALLTALPEPEEHMRKIEQPTSSDHEAPAPLRAMEERRKTTQLPMKVPSAAPKPTQQQAVFQTDAPPGIFARLMAWIKGG
jgi:serine/threonine protein kinase